MKTSYYYANSKQYGRAWKEVKNYCSVYADWEPLSKWPKLVGKQAWVDLNLPQDASERGILIERYLRELTPKWGKILALQLADEPSWGRIEIGGIARLVKSEMKRLRLEPRPVGATFHYDQIMSGNAWQSVDLDWIGPEFYLKKQANDNATTVGRRMTETCDKLMRRIGRTKRVIPTIMAYDQRKTANPATRTWSEAELLAMQEPAYEAAYNLGKQALCTLWFSYRRPGGTSEYPALKAEHQRLRRLYP